MSLEPRKPNQTPKVFSTYDFEWYPDTLQFRMAGVYDEEKGFRHYPTVAEFLHYELIPENYGRTFFAHNGGKSDIHFVLHELLTSGLARGEYAVEAAFNGSSAFLVYVQSRGDPERRFIFADTLFLLKAALKKIGLWLGYEKMEVDFFTESYSELRDYNERDCSLLYRAVLDLQAELFAMGGEFKSTLASCAMALFTTHYLKHTLRTNKSINRWTRKGYYASRVEVLKKHCKEGNYYDVNSSFPWSMKQMLPGEFLNTTKSLGLKPKGSEIYIADATVTVKDCFLPPLPYRDEEERILFPVGTWRGVFSQPDIELLEEAGHRIDKIHSVDWYEGFTDLGDYVDDLYQKKETSTGFKRELYKLLLNSLYGKFAENGEKQKVLLYPPSPFCTHKHKHANNQCVHMRSPAYWVREDEMKMDHVHVPIPATITAYSRRLLFRHMASCKDVYYCDTDSIVCGKDDILPTGEAVGELKHEYSVQDGLFAAPKLYALYDRMKGEDVVRSKGFSRLDRKSFDAVVAGEGVVIRRMVGLKENFRDMFEPVRLPDGTVQRWKHVADARPREALFVKRALMLRSKRREFPDGTTEPWNVREIKNGASAEKPLGVGSQEEGEGT